MDMAGPHFPYVIAAYAVTALIMALLAYWVIRRDNKAARAWAEWENNDA